LETELHSLLNKIKRRKKIQNAMDDRPKPLDKSINSESTYSRRPHPSTSLHEELSASQKLLGASSYQRRSVAPRYAGNYFPKSRLNYDRITSPTYSYLDEYDDSELQPYYTLNSDLERLERNFTISKRRLRDHNLWLRDFVSGIGDS